jgi:hypothetical protein
MQTLYTIAVLDPAHMPHVHTWVDALRRACSHGWHFHIADRRILGHRESGGHEADYVRGYFRRLFDEWAERQ